MALSDLQDIDTLFLSSKLNRLQSEFLLKPFSCDSGGDFDKFLFDEAKYHLTQVAAKADIHINFR
jgi:hypothetical protein